MSNITNPETDSSCSTCGVRRLFVYNQMYAMASQMRDAGLEVSPNMRRALSHLEYEMQVPNSETWTERSTNLPKLQIGSALLSFCEPCKRETLMVVQSDHLRCMTCKTRLPCNIPELLKQYNEPS